MGAALTKTHDNVIPFKQPVQPSLFEQTTSDNHNTKRVDPSRAMVKFGVRRDVDDIPLVKAKQLGLEEEDRTVPKVATPGIALSERAILRAIEGSDVSGHRRMAFSAEVDEAVESYFHSAQAHFGFDRAVLMLFSLLSGSPDYMREDPPGWVLQLFADERALLFETYHGHLDDRRTDLATIDDGEDE